MTGVLLVAILAAAPTTYTAQPNVFDPAEMSSEAIYVGVQTCMTASGGETKGSLVVCGCVMDAVRLNTKAGKRAPENNATAQQVTICIERAKSKSSARPGRSG